MEQGTIINLLSEQGNWEEEPQKRKGPRIKRTGPKEKGSASLKTIIEGEFDWWQPGMGAPAAFKTPAPPRKTPNRRIPRTAAAQLARRKATNKKSALVSRQRKKRLMHYLKEEVPKAEAELANLVFDGVSWRKKNAENLQFLNEMHFLLFGSTKYTFL